ncbi:hypothetical protein Ancab_015597, partial [Ancistrocladus abbreviatus]
MPMFSRGKTLKLSKFSNLREYEHSAGSQHAEARKHSTSQNGAFIQGIWGRFQRSAEWKYQRGLQTDRGKSDWGMSRRMAVDNCATPSCPRPVDQLHLIECSSFSAYFNSEFGSLHHDPCFFLRWCDSE